MKKEYKAFECALQIKNTSTGPQDCLSYKVVLVLIAHQAVNAWTAPLGLMIQWLLLNDSQAADLNKLVPEMMGVSPAILESVVFVHQVHYGMNDVARSCYS